MSESFYGLAIVGGPILLAIVILWAMFHNKRSRQAERQTEDATRRLYKEQEQEDRAREGN